MSDINGKLKQIFESYAAFGAKGNQGALDSAKFAKLCRQSKIISGRIMQTDVDIIFMKVKEKSDRKINFPTFLVALQELGKVKFPGKSDDDAFADVVHLILSAGFARAQSQTTIDTSGIFDKLTDKTLYTGQHRKGSIGDGKPTETPRQESSTSLTSAPPQPQSPATPKADLMADVVDEVNDDDLKPVFSRYCSFGDKTNKTLLDSAKLTKMMRDSGLLDGKLVKPMDVDIIFTKCKKKGERRLRFPEFRLVLRSVAKKRFRSVGPAEAYAQAKQAILNTTPSSQSTATSASGIFDKLTDTSLYTGAHKSRFDASGKGMGLKGRDAVAKGGGTVNDSHFKNVPDRTHS